MVTLHTLQLSEFYVKHAEKVLKIVDLFPVLAGDGKGELALNQHSNDGRKLVITIPFPTRVEAILRDRGTIRNTLFVGLQSFSVKSWPFREGLRCKPI